MSTAFLLHSTRKDGHMGVSAPENRKAFFKKTGIGKNNVVDAVPSHGNSIKVVGKKDGGKYFEGVDGLITKEKGIYLSLTAADCMPVALFDNLSNSIALIHCGWRGLENGILKKAVRKMTNGKSENGELIVHVGPHICSKHYVRDLAEEAKSQLTESGVPEKNISIDKECTYESNQLFSYREGDKKERNLYLFVNI